MHQRGQVHSRAALTFLLSPGGSGQSAQCCSPPNNYKVACNNKITCSRSKFISFIAFVNNPKITALTKGLLSQKYRGDTEDVLDHPCLPLPPTSTEWAPSCGLQRAFQELHQRISLLPWKINPHSNRYLHRVLFPVTQLLLVLIMSQNIMSQTSPAIAQKISMTFRFCPLKIKVSSTQSLASTCSFTSFNFSTSEWI